MERSCHWKFSNNFCPTILAEMSPLLLGTEVAYKELNSYAREMGSNHSRFVIEICVDQDQLLHLPLKSNLHVGQYKD